MTRRIWFLAQPVSRTARPMPMITRITRVRTTMPFPRTTASFRRSRLKAIAEGCPNGINVGAESLILLCQIDMIGRRFNTCGVGMTIVLQVREAVRHGARAKERDEIAGVY